MSVDNLSLVLHKKGDLRLENTKIKNPGKNEVQIAIHSVGICGSDVHYWQNGKIGDFIVNSPMILGHESSGTVVKVGEGVTHLKLGDRVAIEPGVPCRHCEFCKTGRYNLCRDVVFCATPPIDGTLTRYYVHAADFCFELPDHVSLEEGALLEPLSVAVQACRRANVSIGKRVLIFGAGPIGLLNLLTAKAMGASETCIVDVVDSRLKFAKELGATYTVLSDTKDGITLAEKVKTTMNAEPDISIDCCGVELAISTSIYATKSGGIILLVGMGPDKVTVPLVNAAIREIDIRGIFRYANCYPTALQLVATGAVNLKPLVTHRFKLEESLKAFETARNSASGAIKVVIQCQKE
ncbi:sorbitol dehydrogenase-like [Centruroides sculpturatus]|uniref:sorbitol dehydrogenase-like n=1 Tax=Centruroides sculpturatus TaxID=218467 RepID=UPI000C6D5A7B|nr:sorbitol dehydrogenase-like [Centruroides sculpturatus]